MAPLNNIMFIDGLPGYFTLDQAMEVLESFGPLGAFYFTEEDENGISSGSAFFIYEDVSVTDAACEVLDGIIVDGKMLIVGRANEIFGGREPATKVLCMTRLITERDLIKDEVYEFILEDMKKECGKYGGLVNVVVPRPNPNGEPLTGIGKVFLEYADTDSSTRAREKLNGRCFALKRVVVRFYPEDKFNQGEYDG